jgi:predicted DNA-binding protein
MRKRIFTRTVGVMLSEETYQKLVAITDAQEVTISSYIRNLVEAEILKIQEREEN